MIKLTIEERYDLVHHVSRLPCTVAFRMAIDEFQAIVDFDATEITEKEIVVDPKTYEIKSNDPDYTKEFDKLPDAVLAAMATFITKYDVDETKDDAFVQSAIELFKKVIDGLIAE